MWKKGERQFSLLHREILDRTQSGMMRFSEQNMGDALLMFPSEVLRAFLDAYVVEEQWECHFGPGV
ncbi:hypothetical protein Hdeb2414_s0028g00702531 [Helianthus debilis subsp. tardiflorus]